MMTMKNLRYALGLFSLLLVTSCVRDNTIRPQPNPIRQYSLIEDFNNDDMGWSFADPVNYAYGVVSNGTFKFDYNDDYTQAYYVAQNFGFNPYNDFTITTKLGSNNNMGLLFGYNESNNSYGYSFTIDYDGYYALYDEGGNGYGPDIQTLVEPQTNNYVNINGDWNELSIKQIGNRWIGYVNGNQVFSLNAQKFRGNGVGFVDIANTQGEVDYLDVHWLN